MFSWSAVSIPQTDFNKLKIQNPMRLSPIGMSACRNVALQAQNSFLGSNWQGCRGSTLYSPCQQLLYTSSKPLPPTAALQPSNSINSQMCDLQANVPWVSPIQQRPESRSFAAFARRGKSPLSTSSGSSGDESSSPSATLSPTSSPSPSPFPLDTRVEQKELHKEASESYLAYAMSVILGRALPDVRDGLKPVHRRILYSMHELGLSSNKPFRKCARVVGEVLGKFHPHGDTAVYDALVRMAQDFSLRSPLINGHGNFGSVDADPPAAMRYTECRLQTLAESMLLADIEYDTVDFVPNFDGSTAEPSVLPSRLPHLLINGSQGIAVGMATNIPPHNLGEVVDALCALIHNPNISVFELMEFCPGPDFPTGGSILGSEGILQAYKSGSGSLSVRGAAHIEELEGRSNKSAVVITQIPYQCNKAALVERIADLVNNKVLEGVSDIRDESDRSGMRVVVEVKRGALAPVVLNSLYKHTALQGRFSCNFVGLVNNEPKQLSLKSFLQVFLDFRCHVIERRTNHKLRKAEERNHQVEGFLAAMAAMDSIVSIIRSSKDSSSASTALQSGAGLSQAQAEAVLAMPLRRLTSLEKSKLEAEHSLLASEIGELKNLLSLRENILKVIADEALALKTKFGTPRRTRIDQWEGDVSDEDLVPNDNILVTMSQKGYVKRMSVDSLTQQSRNTKGRSGGKLRGDDVLNHCVACRAHDKLLMFSTKGIVYTLKGYQIPQVGRSAVGTPILQILPLEEGERITSVLPVCEFSEELSLVMLTAGGWIKKTALSAFSNARKNGLMAIQLESGDELRWVRMAADSDFVLIGSQKGQMIRCKAEQLRRLGRATRGVTAMKLTEGDALAEMDVLPAVASETKETGPWILVVTAGGQGKRVATSAFRSQARKGSGCTYCKLVEDDRVVAIRVVGKSPEDEGEEVVVGSHGGILNRFRVHDISIQGRTARGVSVMKLQENDKVQSVSLVPVTALELADNAPLRTLDVSTTDVE